MSVDILQKEHFGGPISSRFSFCKQFKEYEKTDYGITIFDSNNCVLIGNNVVLIRNFIDVNSDQLVVFQMFEILQPHCMYPLDSSYLQVYRVYNLANKLVCSID